MADFNSERRYALYKRFYIGDEASGYRLHLEDYEGTAGINSSYKNYEYSGCECHKNEERSYNILVNVMDFKSKGDHFSKIKRRLII